MAGGGTWWVCTASARYHTDAAAMMLEERQMDWQPALFSTAIAISRPCNIHRQPAFYFESQVHAQDMLAQRPLMRAHECIAQVSFRTHDNSVKDNRAKQG